MAAFKLESLSGFGAEFRGAKGSLDIQVSPEGRLISVSYGRKWLHHRHQRKPGGRKWRLPSDKVKSCFDAIALATAARALGIEHPTVEIDL